jgi:hypothetical protein
MTGDRVKQLEAALLEQWHYNHFEHCGKGSRDSIAHDGECYWPLPIVLGGSIGVYRTYDDPAPEATSEEKEP